MTEFSLDVKRIRRGQFWDSLIFSGYLLITAGVGIMLITIAILPSWRWVGPEYAKFIYFGFIASFAALTYLVSRELSRFNKYYNHVLIAFRNTTIMVDENQIILKEREEKIHFALNDLELHNYLLNSNVKNPFFGNGFLKIITDSKKEIIIPSLLFHHSVGAYTVKDLFKNHTKYTEQKIKWNILADNLKLK